MKVLSGLAELGATQRGRCDECHEFVPALAVLGARPLFDVGPVKLRRPRGCAGDALPEALRGGRAVPPAAARAAQEPGRRGDRRRPLRTPHLPFGLPTRPRISRRRAHSSALGPPSAWTRGPPFALYSASALAGRILSGPPRCHSSSRACRHPRPPFVGGTRIGALVIRSSYAAGSAIRIRSACGSTRLMMGSSLCGRIASSCSRANARQVALWRIRQTADVASSGTGLLLMMVEVAFPTPHLVRMTEQVILVLLTAVATRFVTRHQNRVERLEVAWADFCGCGQDALERRLEMLDGYEDPEMLFPQMDGGDAPIKALGDGVKASQRRLAQTLNLLKMLETNEHLVKVAESLVANAQSDDVQKLDLAQAKLEEVSQFLRLRSQGRWRARLRLGIPAALPVPEPRAEDGTKSPVSPTASAARRALKPLS